MADRSSALKEAKKKLQRLQKRRQNPWGAGGGGGGGGSESEVGSTVASSFAPSNATASLAVSPSKKATASSSAATSADMAQPPSLNFNSNGNNSGSGSGNGNGNDNGGDSSSSPRSSPTKQRYHHQRRTSSKRSSPGSQSPPKSKSPSKRSSMSFDQVGAGVGVGVGAGVGVGGRGDGSTSPSSSLSSKKSPSNHYLPVSTVPAPPSSTPQTVLTERGPTPNLFPKSSSSSSATDLPLLNTSTTALALIINDDQNADHPGEPKSATSASSSTSRLPLKCSPRVSPTKLHISRTDPFTQPAPLPLASDAVLITSSPTTPTDLAQHNNYLSALTTNLSTENYALIDKIKQLEAEISTLKSDPVIKSPLTIASSTSSPAGSSGEESEFKSKLIKLGGELFDERARCDALIAELEAERNNSVQASRDYVLAMDRLHQMESASEALESQIAQLAAESKASMDHVGVQTGGLVTEEEMQSEVALSSLSEENARLKEQISQLESSVADLQVSAAGATTATTAASAEDGWDVEVDWDVTDHPKEKSAQSESIVSFNQRVMELESYLSEKDSKIVSLTAELEETSIRFQNEFQQSQAQAKAAHEQEVLELSSRLRDALARLENRAELNASTAAALSSENEQQLQREDLLAQLDDVVTQRDDLASKLTHLAQEFGKMRQGYEDASFDARQEKDADLARFEELSSQYQQAIGEIESLRQLSSTVEEHHQQALSEIQSLKEENERVNQQAAFLNNEVKEIRDREAAHSSDVTSLVESFRDLNEQQTANKSEIQRLLEENTQLLFTLEDAKGQMATLKQSHSEEILAALGSAAAAVDSEEVVALKQARDEAVNRLQELYNENNLLQNELHLATEARLRLESDTEKAVATLEASLNAAHSEKEDLLYELESSRQAQEAVQLQLDSSLLERDEISRQFASKVQEMEDQSSQLLEKIAELETQVETLNREMDESRKSLYSDMASSVNLQKEYEQSSQIVDHLTRENTAVTERVALLNASLAEAEQTAARHAQELSDFKAYYEPLVQQLQADAIEKEKQVYEYQQNMEEYIKGIQNELSSCQDQLSDTRNKFETMEAENGKFGETVSELQQRCKLADQQVQEQLVAIAQLELEKQHTSQYLQQQLSQSALEFDEKLRPLEISNQELLITNDVLKNQLSERLASETEISGLKVMVSELEDSLFTERDHLLEAQKKYSSAEEEKNNIVLDLQVAEERITTLNNTVSELRFTIQNSMDSADKVSALQDQVVSITADRDDLQRRLAEHEQYANQLSSDKDYLHVEQERILSRMAELEAEKEQLSDQVYTERSELENTRQTKSFFENTLISITRQINDIKRVHSSENLAQQLQEEPTQPNLQDLVSLIQDLDSIKRSQELEINNLRLEMENQVDLLNKVSSADSDAKIQLDQALEEKQVLISTNQNLSNQVYSLSLKIADIEKELESMASYRNDLESTNQAWVAYEVTMRQQLDEAVQMSSEKEEKCHRLSAQISSLEGSLKELLELQSTTSSLEVSSLKNSLVQKENEIAALTRKLDTAFSRSQSSGKSPTTGVATANSLFGGVIGGEKASSMGNNHDVELLRGQLDLLQEQLELKETELLTSVSLLNTRLAQAEEMTAVYNERCESANASVEVYRVELDKYSKKIHELETEINQWRDASLSKLGAASSNNILSTSSSIDFRVMDSFRDAGETARAIDSLVQSAKDRSDFCCGHKSCHQAECKVSQLSPTRRAFSPTATSLDKQAQTSPVKLNPAPAPPNSIIQGAADSLIRGFFGAANSTGFNEEIYKNVITAQDVADLHNKIERLKGELDMKQSELACTTTTLHSELLKAEQKITKLTFVSESAEASMVMYRGELEKKSKKLLDLEDEIAQLKEDSLANKPTYASSSRAISPSSSIDYRVMNSFKDAGETARAIDSLVQSAKEKSEFCCGHQECHKHGCNAASAKTHYHPGGAAESALSSNTSEVGLLEQLWNRLDSLANTTEQNMEISQSIFKLVTPNNDDAPHPPHQHLSTMIHSQSGILMEQRRLIKEIDSISRSLNNNSNHNNNRPAPIETSSSPQASSSTTKPTASSINASYFYSSSATDTPVLKLTSIIETYQAIVTRYISKKRTDIIHGQALRLDSTQEIDDLNRQFDDLSRQMHYLSSLFTTSIMASSNTDLRVAGMVAPSPGPASSQVVGKEYKLSSSQYAVLIAKATQSEHLEIQFDNTHALLKDHANEINTLKEAIDAITSAAPHHTSTSASSRTGSVSSLVSASGGGVGGGPPSSEVRILQKQAEELRKVWSHELEANSILRSLIAKTQNDSINSTHEYAAREAGMKEEIDELVSALESNSREVSFYKSRITELEKRYQYDGQSATPASSTIHQSFRRSFSVEHSSDDVDQLKETIKKMDTERSRLISDFKIIKKKFDEKIIVWKSKYDDSTRLSDTLKRSSEEEERKFKSAISNFEILKSNWEVDRNRMEVEIKTLKAELDTTKQDRNRVLSSSNNSATLYNNDGALRLEYEKKISIMELRIKDLEGEIRVLLVERDSSNQKVTNMTQRFEVYEAQLKRERDRVKKYALKVEELRKRTADAGSATTPNFESSIGKSPSVENLLQNEVLVLRKELQHAQNSHSEMLNILHQTVNGIIGDRGDEETAAKIRQQQEKEESGKLKIDITRLRVRCSLATQEVIYLRSIIGRLAIQRSDLQYQKRYLSLIVADLHINQKVTLSYIKGMGGNPIPQSEYASPRKKFIRCVNTSRAICRIRILARNWRVILENYGQDLDEKSLIEIISTSSRPHSPTSIPTLTHDELVQMRYMEQEIGNLRMDKSELERRLNAELAQLRYSEMENQRLLNTLQDEQKTRNNLERRLEDIFQSQSLNPLSPTMDDLPTPSSAIPSSSAKPNRHGHCDCCRKVQQFRKSLKERMKSVESAASSPMTAIASAPNLA